MKLFPISHKRNDKLPYDGEKIEFLAKNMKIPIKRVFDVLSVISVSSDDLALFLISKRHKDRQRRIKSYPNNDIAIK
jgi:hypothetical protein